MIPRAFAPLLLILPLLNVAAGDLVVLKDTLSDASLYKKECTNNGLKVAHLNTLSLPHISQTIRDRSKEFRFKKSAWIGEFQGRFREYPMFVTSQKDDSLSLTVILAKRGKVKQELHCMCEKPSQRESDEALWTSSDWNRGTMDTDSSNISSTSFNDGPRSSSWLENNNVSRPSTPSYLTSNSDSSRSAHLSSDTRNRLHRPISSTSTTANSSHSRSSSSRPHIHTSTYSESRTSTPSNSTRPHNTSTSHVGGSQSRPNVHSTTYTQTSTSTSLSSNNSTIRPHNDSPSTLRNITSVPSSTTTRTTSNVTYEDDDDGLAKAIAASLSDTPATPSVSTTTSTRTNTNPGNSSNTVTTTTTLTSPSGNNNANNSTDANDCNYSEEELKEMLRFSRKETTRTRWYELLTKPGVGTLKYTVKSLAWTLFWYVRIMQVDDPIYHVLPFELERLRQSFRNALGDLQSMCILDVNDEELGKLDEHFHKVKEYVASRQLKPPADAAKALCYLWKHAMLTVDKKAGYFCLILALETKYEERLNSLRWFSVHGGPTFPKLSETEWNKLQEIAGETMGKFKEKMLRMLGAHGPKKLRNSVLRTNMATVLEDMQMPSHVAQSTASIPVVDLGKADRPEFDPRTGEFKISANYKEFIKALEEYILKGERTNSLTVEIYQLMNGVKRDITFTDAGGPRRAFLTAFGMLFRVHAHLMIESEKGSMCIHPMATEEVYSYFANMLGLLGRANKQRNSLKVSIGYFLAPEYAEFLFDPDVDRIPTKEEVKRFFPNIEKEFAECYSLSPEDAPGVYDTRHSIGFTNIINQFNVGKLGDVHDPKDEADLRRLKEKYVEKIQLNLIHGHQIFIQNLQTFFDGHYDFENLDLLIARRGELEADEVNNALKFWNCANLTVIYDDQGGRRVSFEEAVKRMVTEMTPEERANMFMYGTGSVPPILTLGCLEIRGNGSSRHSWSASSCNGYISPPMMTPGSNTQKYTILFEALKVQCAMDAGSTAGNEGIY